MACQLIQTIIYGFSLQRTLEKSTYKGKGVLRYEQKNLGESIVASVTGENKIF